jgi:hypothetical protein
MAFEKYMGFEADGRVDPADRRRAHHDDRAPHRSRRLRHPDRGRQGQAVAVLRHRRAHRLDPEHLDRQRGGVHRTAPEPARRASISGVVDHTDAGCTGSTANVPEGWWEGDLGEIYRPKYFVGGVAVHGSNSIPNYPASHGCVRVSVPAMDWIWDSGIMPMRSPVWVHDGA